MLLDQLIATAEARRFLLAASVDVTPKQWDAIMSTELEDMTHAATADQAGVTRSAVNDARTRGLRKLRRNLKRMGINRVADLI